MIKVLRFSWANDYIKELNLDTECEIKFLEDFLTISNINKIN